MKSDCLRLISQRTHAESIHPRVVNMVDIPISYKELHTNCDVSDLISPILQNSLGFQDLKVSEVIVGSGIGIKAIASCAVNFKIMITHGEVLIRYCLRLDNDCDLFAVSKPKKLAVGVPLDLTAEVVTIEAVKGLSTFAIAAFIYL